MPIIATNDKEIEKLVLDPTYEIYENGSIYNKKTARYLIGTRSRPDRNGRSYLKIRVRKRGPQLSVHRIVFRKFYGFLKEDLVINHKDGNPENNHKDNLELVTVSKNNSHKHRVTGVPPIAGFRKITRNIAEEIRKMHEDGLSYREILRIVTP